MMENNIYLLEQMAHDRMQERLNEAKALSRWSQLRKSTQSDKGYTRTAAERKPVLAPNS